jgi:hypothetical protein
MNSGYRLFAASPSFLGREIPLHHIPTWHLIFTATGAMRYLSLTYGSRSPMRNTWTREC